MAWLPDGVQSGRLRIRLHYPGNSVSRLGGIIEPVHCDAQGRCQGYLPGTKGIHGYLHDHVALYRAWHHSPLRAPTHTIITILAITLAGITLANIARQAPVQAATGIFAEFPFQGRLTNSDGTVVGNGSYDAVFKLYTVDTGGVPLWTESHTGANKITATDGVFSTMLGSLNSLSGIDFNQDQYWLGITVGADSEMTPRIRLGAAPYSFNSDKLDGISSEAFLQLPGQAGGQTAYGGTAASQNLVLRSTSNATKGSVLIADDGGAVRVGTSGNASLSVPGTGSLSQTLGVGASASGSLGSIAIGNLADASTYEALAVGFVSDASGLMSTAIGGRAEATGVHSIALGNRSVADEDNALVIGDNFEAGFETKNIYFGYGRVSSFAELQTSTLNATGGLGTNIGGTALQLAGGRGTGSAGGGSVKISTAPAGSSGSSLNALVERLTVTDTGNIVPGTGALATSATDGFVYLDAMAGAPTGTPTSFAGRTPITYDTTGNALYVYNSGWQAIGGGSGISGSGVAGRVTYWNGVSSVTSSGDFLWDAANNRLRIGTASVTANSGNSTVNFKNGGGVSWRNAANSADKAFTLDGNDDYQFTNDGTGTVTLSVDPNAAERNFQIYNGGGGVASLQLEGALKVYNTDAFGSSIASSGDVRLQNNGTVTWRNVTNSRDQYITVNGRDDYEFLNDGAGVVTLAVDDNAAERNFQIYNGGGGVASLQLEGALKVYNTDAFGSSIASSGDVRLQNGSQISWRNASNSADRTFALNSGDQFQFQSDGSLVTTLATSSNAATSTFSLVNPGGGAANLSIEGDYYDTTIPTSVSSTTLCISGGGQIGTCTSDARLKQNIADLGSGLDVIEQLSPKTYDFVSGQTGQSGFLAQDVQQVLPGLVTKDTGDDYLSLNYNGIVAYAVKAIQELNDRVDNLPVASATHLASLHVTGATTIDGQLAVNGSATFGGDIAVAGDLTVNGAIKGSKQTRGFNVAVPEAASTFTQDGLDLPADGAYSVSILPSWLTNVSITAKGTDSFTIGFSTPAPAGATIDYQIQE